MDKMGILLDYLYIFADLGSKTRSMYVSSELLVYILHKADNETWLVQYMLPHLKSVISTIIDAAHYIVTGSCYKYQHTPGLKAHLSTSD